MSKLLASAREYSAFGVSIIPVRKKKAAMPWKQYQIRCATDAELVRMFAQPGLTGLAAIGGEVSGGLICRDFDVSGGYERWGERHAELAKALPTVRTGRGFHVYARAADPMFAKLSDGELRGRLHYTLLPPSKHFDSKGQPTGKVYEIVQPFSDRALLRIDPAELLGSAEDETEQTEQAEQAEQTEAVDLDEFASEIEIAIRLTLPTGYGQRNRRVFDFARALKGIPELAKMPSLKLEPIVRRWHRRALKNIQTKPFDDCWMDFLVAWPKIHTPAGALGVVDLAWRAAIENDPPEAASRLERRELRLLLALCRELHRLTEPQPFYLSCRTVERLQGIDHVTASRWLKHLTLIGYLAVVAKGTKARAARYRYLAGE